MLKKQNKVRQRREELHYTLEQLSSKTGISRSYLSQVERGVKTPTVYFALQIANALNCEVKEIFIDDKR